MYLVISYNLHLNLLGRSSPKWTILFSCLSLDVLPFNFEKSLKNHLLIELNSFLCYLLESKAFSPLQINYLRYYFLDYFTRINMVAAMPPVMVLRNVFLKLGFVNIYAFQILLKKKVTKNKITAV